MSLESLCYLIAAVASALAGLTLLRTTRSPLVLRMRLTFFAGTVWALLLAGGVWLTDGGGRSGALLALSAELLRYGFLLYLMNALNRPAVGDAISKLNFLMLLGAGALGLVGVFTLPPDRSVGFAGLVLALAGLVNTEQLLRHAGPQTAKAAKLCALGFGGQLAYDLFLFSQVELLGALDQRSLAVRGLVVALFTPLAVVGLRRLAAEATSFFISRQVVLYTTAVLSVGIYLLLMALGGYYVRVHGGTWGEALRILFLVGAGVVLVVLTMSTVLWRRLRVFVAKHFYRNKYDYRVEWLRFINTLSVPETENVSRISVRAIAQILESPAGILFLRSDDASRFEPVAAWSSSGPEEPLPESVEATADLPRFLSDRQWVVELSEYLKFPEFYQYIRIPEWLLRADNHWRIVSPLLELDRLVGFLVLRTPPEPFEMTFEDRDLLRTAGRHVATLMAQQAANRRLAESRQFDAFNRFAAFVMHDLKNSVAQLQLLVANADRHRHNPEFMDDAIETVGNTSARMTRLIEQLQRRDTLGERRPVQLAGLLSGVVNRCATRPPGVHLENGGSRDTVSPAVLADPDRLATVLDHVVRNAQDAAGGAGRVQLALSCDASWACIAVSDNGPGMDPAFVRDRLFRPFDSTKGSKGMGIGAYQAREYVRQLGGEVEVQSSPGHGTTFLIRLPLCPPTANPNS